MAASLSLPETNVIAFSGARANDHRLTNAIEGLQRGQYQQAILFIGGNGLKQWKGRPADSPEAVSFSSIT